MVFLGLQYCLADGGQGVVVFKRDGSIVQGDGEVQILSDVLWKVHPGGKYVMKEGFDYVQQWGMSTGKGWIEIEVPGCSIRGVF